MGILPGLLPGLQEQIDNISNTTTPTTVEKLGKCFFIDFEKEEFTVEDGKLQEVNKKVAISQWIKCIFDTKKNQYKIYQDTDFYSNIEDLIGKNSLNGFVIAELQREITLTLTKHRYIKSVSNFQIGYNYKLKDKSKDQLIINFTVNLIDGTSIEESIGGFNNV